MACAYVHTCPLILWHGIICRIKNSKRQAKGECKVHERKNKTRQRRNRVNSLHQETQWAQEWLYHLRELRNEDSVCGAA